MGRGNAFDSLEPDRKIEHKKHEGGPHCEGGDGTKCDGALLEDARWDRRFFTAPKLDTHESDEEDGRTHNQTNDGGGAPCMFTTTPLERQQEGNDPREEDGSTDEVKLLQFVTVAEFVGLNAIRRGEEEDDDDNSHSADRQVDVETPSPGCMISERATHERAGDRSDPVHAADKTGIYGTFAERDRVSEDDQSAREDTCATKTSDSPTNDQGL